MRTEADLPLRQPRLRICDDFNLYAYAYNDPVNRSDPTGLAEEKEDSFTNEDAGKCGSRVGQTANCTSAATLEKGASEKKKNERLNTAANTSTTASGTAETLEEHTKAGGKLKLGVFGRLFEGFAKAFTFTKAANGTAHGEYEEAATTITAEGVNQGMSAIAATGVALVLGAEEFAPLAGRATSVVAGWSGADDAVSKHVVGPANTALRYTNEQQRQLNLSISRALIQAAGGTSIDRESDSDQ